MRFDGADFYKEDTENGIKMLKPQIALRGKSKVDQNVRRKIALKPRTKADTRSLAGLISLSKEFTNPKFLAQMKDTARIKKTFGRINTKFERDFRSLQRNHRTILTARPQAELRIKRLRPRKLIERYYVSASAPEGGNGSQSNPFRTITQALDRAAQLGHILVHVHIESGSYIENLEITRYTHLIGTNVSLWGSIENSGHHLHMKGIHIRNAVGYGIRQTGGTLIFEYCSVLGTSFVASDLESGTAIHLSNGTEALLTNFSIIENQGRAILLKGEGTKAEVRTAWIGLNTLTMGAIESCHAEGSRIGTVEVANGAKLLMEHFLFTSNFVGGVVVLNNSQAHLRFGLIDNTTGYELPHGGRRLGQNLVSLENSIVEIRHFITQAPDGIGLFVQNAYLTATNGDVQNCLLAIWVDELPADYSWEQCIDVQFANNEYHVEGSFGGELAVPNTPMPIPGEPAPEAPEAPEFTCPHVDWDSEDGTPRRG